MGDQTIPMFKVLMAPNLGDALNKTLHSGYIAQGSIVDQFEEELNEALELPPDQHAVTVNSGTSALHLAYHLAGIGQNSRVIVSPMTCAATITPLVHMGACIEWADVDPVTGLIDPTYVETVCHRNIKAIVAIDWAGVPADVWSLRRIVNDEIPIIEDAAHALFARDKDGEQVAGENPMGYVTFSLQAIKHLTTGDGGILVPPASETKRATLLRWFGLDRTSSKDFRCEQDIVEAGYKYQMNDIDATIGLANLSQAQKAVTLHRRNAWRINEALSIAARDAELPGITIPPFHHGASYWFFPLLVDDRPSFQRHLAERGIATSQVHRRCDEYSVLRDRRRSLPGLDRFAARQIGVPCGWFLTNRDLNRIIDAIVEWSESR